MKKSVSYFLLGVFVALLASVGVYAFGTSNPAVFGHTSGEIEFLENSIPSSAVSGNCESGGSDCPTFKDQRFTINAQGQLCFASVVPNGCALSQTTIPSGQEKSIYIGLCGGFSPLSNQMACDLVCGEVVAYSGDVTEFSCGAPGVAYYDTASYSCNSNALYCTCTNVNSDTIAVEHYTYAQNQLRCV